MDKIRKQIATLRAWADTDDNDGLDETASFDREIADTMEAMLEVVEAAKIAHTHGMDAIRISNDGMEPSIREELGDALSKLEEQTS